MANSTSVAADTCASAAPELDSTCRSLAPVITYLARCASAKQQCDPLFDAEDLAQEMWLKLLSRRDGVPQFQTGLGARLYLTRVAESVVYSRWRARQAACRSGADSYPHDDSEIVQPGLDPEQRTLCRERVRAAERVLRRSTAPKLRARNGTLLAWFWVEGREPEEISRLLGGRILPNSVATVIARAKNTVRRGVR